MDLRDELKSVRSHLSQIRNILGCKNFVQIPSKIDAIVRNTDKKRRPKKP
jgi:hypothetical protein